MQLSAFGAFIALLCAPVLAQSTAPSQTFYGTATVTNGPECTGCLLEAVHPTPLSYPGTVYCIDIYIISTVPSSIRYTTTKPDGCTSYIYSSYTASIEPVSTTSVTWGVNGTTLTWPTTYYAYSTFEAGTWTRGGDSDCTISPQTVSAQSAIIYPASSFPGSLAPVPSQVVQSIIHDPSIDLPFNIETCTANGVFPNPLHANLEPECSCTAVNTPPPSCIQLPDITSTIPNTFTHSGYRQHREATPPARLHMRLDAVDDASTTSHTRRHVETQQQGTIDGGDYPSSGADEGTDSPAETSASSTPTVTTTNSSNLSSTSRPSNSGTSSPGFASISSFIA